MSPWKKPKVSVAAMSESVSSVDSLPKGPMPAGKACALDRRVMEWSFAGVQAASIANGDLLKAANVEKA